MSKRNNNNDDERDGERRELAFILLVPILGLSFLPISGSFDDLANECTTTTCYPNPTVWALNSTITGGPGAVGSCTNSATYAAVDNGHTLTVTSPSSPPANPNSLFLFYTVYDFDYHVTAAGTTGKVTLYDTAFGIAFAPVVSRETTINLANSIFEAGTLQGTQIQFGPGSTDTFGIAALRTAGLGSICIDSVEGLSYVLAVGGHPA